MIGGCADRRTDIQTDYPDRTKLHSYISISPIGSIYERTANRRNKINNLTKPTEENKEKKIYM